MSAGGAVAAAQITIDGRAFEVTRDGDQYVLTGQRGARYRTLRNRGKDTFYLVNDIDWKRSTPVVQLTDRTGVLEVSQP